MSKNVAVFCSENENAVIADTVRRVLRDYDYFVVYTKNIEAVILRKFTNINFLIIDNSNECLNSTLYQLIEKLRESGYIRRLIVISKTPGNNFENNVVYDNDFCESFSTAVKRILSTNTQVLPKAFQSSWYKVIGNFLTDIGFSLKHEGYMLLIDALIIIMSNNCIVKNLNKELFVILANKYNESVSCVEINIRKAISLANKCENFPFEKTPSIKEFLTYAVTELYDKIFSNTVMVAF